MADERPEFALIEWIRRRTVTRPEVLIGIGDDASVLQGPQGRNWITTVDVLTEGVHFDLAAASPELVGRKAMNANVSDIAAMAGEPVAAFIGIVLPRSRGRLLAEAIYAGLFDAARQWNVTLAGGDTNSWDGPLVISVTLMGLTTGQGAVTRSGGKPGDWLFVTGALGGSLMSGRHLTFTPRVNEAIALHRSVSLTSMLDISDGLASDLFHLLDESHVGARLDGDAVPIHEDVPSALPADVRLGRALNDGEDFELLFTVSPDDGVRLLRESPCGTPLTKIGELTNDRNVSLRVHGEWRTLARGGWTHSLDVG